jgi:hypothetical protein
MLYAGYYNLSGAASSASSRAASAANSADNSRRPSEKAESVEVPSEEKIYEPATTERRSSLQSLFHRKEKKETKEPQKLKWNMSRAQYELISAAA